MNFDKALLTFCKKTFWVLVRVLKVCLLVVVVAVVVAVVFLTATLFLKRVISMEACTFQVTLELGTHRTIPACPAGLLAQHHVPLHILPWKELIAFW